MVSWLGAKGNLRYFEKVTLSGGVTLLFTINRQGRSARAVVVQPACAAVVLLRELLR